jgi:hypothetical protein
VQAADADVEGQEQQAARPEHPPHLAKRRGQLRAGDVDDGVERDDAAQHAAPQWQRPHVGLGELDPRAQPPRGPDHRCRQVDAHDPGPALVEVAGHVPWPAAEVAGGPEGPHPLGEAVQELPVELLVRQLPAIRATYSSATRS